MPPPDASVSPSPNSRTSSVISHLSRVKPSSLQSRAGFSGRCDAGVIGTPSVPTGVSIPCWVFWPLRHFFAGMGQFQAVQFQSRAGFSGRCDRRRHLRQTQRALFQSRAGFSGRCDRALPGEFSLSIRFQSRAGFSGRCDRSLFPRRCWRACVSIPCWVFWPLRPHRQVARRENEPVSIPCWVFWPLRRWRWRR